MNAVTSVTTLERDTVSLPTDVAAKKRKLRVRHIAMLGAASLVALTAAWYGHAWWSTGRFIESTDDAYVGGDVTVITARVPGYIAELAVTDNQAVKAGDLLAKLDDRDYRATLAKAEAAVAGEQATIANLDAAQRLQRSVIAQAEADTEAAQAEIVVTRYDQARFKKLSTTAAASLQDFQRADADYKQALAHAKRAEASLDAAQRQLDVIAAQKQEAQAALAGAVATRDLAQIDLGYTEIRAPIDGVVGNRAARKGGYAATGAQLISLVPSDGLWVDANFKEDQLADMQPGQAATIEADILPGRVFHGHVASLAPATGAQFSLLPAENATGNFTKIVQRVPVRIVLDGADAKLGLLRPGLSVVAEVDSRAESKAAQ